MHEQFLSELRRGMEVVSADGQPIGRVSDVYHIGLEPRAEPGTLIPSPGAGLPEEIEQGEEAAGYGEPGPVLEPEGFVRVERGQPPALYVPFRAIHRLTDRSVELWVSSDQVEQEGWEQVPELVRAAESRLSRESRRQGPRSEGD